MPLESQRACTQGRTPPGSHHTVVCITASSRGCRAGAQGGAEQLACAVGEGACGSALSEGVRLTCGSGVIGDPAAGAPGQGKLGAGSAGVAGASNGAGQAAADVAGVANDAGQRASGSGSRGGEGEGGGVDGDDVVDLDNLAPDLLELFDMEEDGASDKGSGGSDGLLGPARGQQGAEQGDGGGGVARGSREGAGRTWGMSALDSTGKELGGGCAAGPSGGAARAERAGRGAAGGEGAEGCEGGCGAGWSTGGDTAQEWEACMLATSPLAPTFLARSPPSSRKVRMHTNLQARCRDAGSPCC